MTGHLRSALLEPCVAGERVTKIRWAGLALGLIGAGVVIASRSTVGGGHVRRRPSSSRSPLEVTLPAALILEGFPVEWTGDLAISLAYLVFANSLVAPLAALIAWADLGESLPASAWLGMALAAVGVGIATSSSARDSS